MPRVLGGSLGGGHFLTGEVPTYKFKAGQELGNSTLDRQPSEQDQIALFSSFIRTGDLRNPAARGTIQGN